MERNEQSGATLALETAWLRRRGDMAEPYGGCDDSEPGRRKPVPTNANHLPALNRQENLVSNRSDPFHHLGGDGDAQQKQSFLIGVAIAMVALVAPVLILSCNKIENRKIENPEDIAQKTINTLREKIVVENQISLETSQDSVATRYTEIKDETHGKMVQFESEEKTFQIVDLRNGETFLDMYSYWEEVIGNASMGEILSYLQIFDLGIHEGTIFPFVGKSTRGFIICQNDENTWAKVWRKNDERSVKVIQVGGGSKDFLKSFLIYLEEPLDIF